MKMKMFCNTYWDDRRLKAGDVTDVDEATGKRWEDAGIAVPTASPDATIAEKSLERMNTAELIQKAEELGVDISEASINKERIVAIQAFIDDGPKATAAPDATVIVDDQRQEE